MSGMVNHRLGTDGRPDQGLPRSTGSFTVGFQPLGTRLVCEEPVLLCDAAIRAGVLLNAVCGGNATCGKCLVQVSGTVLSPITPSERLLLSEAEIAAGYRQACRTLVSGDTTVYVPPSSLLQEQKLQVEGTEAKLQLDPTVQKFAVSVPPASLADPRGDLDRTMEALRAQHGADLARADVPTLGQLSEALRAGNWHVTVSFRDGELVHAEPGDATSASVGLAVDLGSTKIACYLVDLLTGRTLAAHGAMNPQIAYGEDVIARIDAANHDEVTRLRLRDIVVDAINRIAAGLCSTAGFTPRDLLEMTVVGNTAMHHLAIGLPVQQLGVIPFAPVTARPLDLKCAQLGLAAAPGAYAHFPAPIAGFVGSDHVAALLASQFGEDERTRLLVDLGTNTEIGLQVGGRIVSCSTACGPAFEGAHVKFGMRAAPGAVEHVKISPTKGDVRATTIGGRPAVGICGSGILDAVAELLKAGWMDDRGRLVPSSPSVRPSFDGRAAEFVLADGREDGGREVVLTQRDLGEIQLAKGAMRAGIDLLMEDAGLRPSDLDEVVVAGAFGSYLDPVSAVRLGMFPPVPISRFKQVGNAAGVGAKQVLLSRQARARMAQLSKEVNYLELTLHPRFSQSFANSMRYRGRHEAPAYT